MQKSKNMKTIWHTYENVDLQPTPLPRRRSPCSGVGRKSTFSYFNKTFRYFLYISENVNLLGIHTGCNLQYYPLLLTLPLLTIAHLEVHKEEPPAESAGRGQDATSNGNSSTARAHAESHDGVKIRKNTGTKQSQKKT